MFGHGVFREGQEAAVDRIMSGGDVLAIMPTGAGKSVCYQLPAVLMSGITLVISPLISLMKDQASALSQCGVSSAYLNSSLSAQEFNMTLQLAADGVYKVLYVAPERLETPEFLAFSKRAGISMVTVDEAHCVSQWGQDFRPSYLKIADFIASLPRRPVVSAFTATATEAVKKDITDKLRLQKPLLITTGFDRPNLYFEVINVSKKEKDALLLDLLRRYNSKSGIIYCMTRKITEHVCAMLNENGVNASRYHAGLSDAERSRNQDDFICDRKTVMAATNAFGMGIDKSNVSFVIHYNLPKSMEAYYQEAGRAGRDGEKADCVLLYTPSDIHTNMFFIDNMQGENLTERELEIAKNRDRARLKAMTGYCSTADCLRGYMLAYFGEKSGKSCKNCSNCLNGFETADITVFAQKIISCVFRLSQRDSRLGAQMIIKILKGSAEKRITESGFDSLSTYGIMEKDDKKDIAAVLDFLLADGYLSASDDEFRTVSLTGKGTAFIRGRGSLFMKKPVEKKAARRGAGEELDENSEELRKLLTALRLKLAEGRRVPAYAIFTNATIREMAQKKPVTPEEFINITGVGAAKLKAYGETFMKAIREFNEEKK